MDKRLDICVHYTNGDMTMAEDVLYYDWSDGKFLTMETSQGKVVVVLENVKYFTVRKIKEENDAEQDCSQD